MFGHFSEHRPEYLYSFSRFYKRRRWRGSSFDNHFHRHRQKISQRPYHSVGSYGKSGFDQLAFLFNILHKGFSVFCTAGISRPSALQSIFTNRMNGFHNRNAFHARFLATIAVCTVPYSMILDQFGKSYVMNAISAVDIHPVGFQQNSRRYILFVCP